MLKNGCKLINFMKKKVENYEKLKKRIENVEN